MWFDVIYDLPHKLEHGFERISLLDKDGLSLLLSRTRRSATGDDDVLTARAQADLRLMHVRRGKWVGIDFCPINSAIVDLLVAVNDIPSYNRYSSRVTRLLHCPRGRESDWHAGLVSA